MSRTTDLNPPLLTVGLPVYNAMPYLPEAIKSLFAQDCGNFEILAIVDGATDGSLEYLRSIQDPRLRILSQSNHGVTATLNRMLRECRTPWLVRQDADDVSHPHRMGQTLWAIQSAPDAGMFYSLANYHPRGRAVGRFRCSRGTPRELRNVVREGYLLSICHSTVTLNVEKTLGLGGYRVGLHNEDADLWWRMALKYEIHCIEEELVGFRQRTESVSSRNLVAQMIAGLYVQYLLLSHLTERAPLAFALIREQLENFVSLAKLRAKEHLRRFNMRLAERNHLHAAMAFSAAIASSPVYVAERVFDEFVPHRGRKPLVNGISPKRFFEHKEVLWQ